MTRYAELYDDILAWDNLRLAWYRASKGKRLSPPVIEFRFRLDENLERLLRTLLDPDLAGIGRYRFFTIQDPKERRICEAPFFDRVLHHAVMNVLEPCFESFQIHDSYACRTGKGTDAALRRSLHFARRYRRFAKLDVRSYFDSIDHDVLRRLLARKFKDVRVLRLLDAIIRSYETQPGKGVPIGNLTSQFFANHYLAVLDHHAKERLEAPGYLRYMDDIVVFADDHDRLRSIVEGIAQFTSSVLRLTLKPPIVAPVSAGIPFLGFLVKPHGIYLTRAKRRRAQKRMNEYGRRFQSGEWSDQTLADHLLPVCAHLSLARSRSVRNTLIKRAGLGHEPGPSRRQLEQQRDEHARGQSQQQRPGQPEQQQRVPACAPVAHR